MGPNIGASATLASGEDDECEKQCNCATECAAAGQDGPRHACVVGMGEQASAAADDKRQEDDQNDPRPPRHLGTRRSLACIAFIFVGRGALCYLHLVSLLRVLGL